MATTTLNVSILRQDDSRWKDEYLGYGDSTIGSSGCALTSFTMIYNYWVSTKKLTGYSTMNVSEMNTFLKNNTSAFSDDRLTSSTAAKYFGFYPYATAGDGENLSDSYTISNISSVEIPAQRPILIGLYNPTSKLTHFVVGYKYDTSSKLTYIRDPSSGWDYESTAEYGYHGFNIYRYTTFSK